jgi:hypothetical protein
MNIIKIFKDWIKKLILRSKRVSNFSLNFAFRRFAKALLFSPIIVLAPFYFFRKYGAYKTIIYKPNLKHIHFYKTIKDQSILLCDHKTFLIFTKNGFSSIRYEFFYSTLNLFINFFIINLILNTNAKRIILNSDYGFDEFFLLRTARFFKKTSICIQHGLFPHTNCKDLDGMDADINIVASNLQKNILQKTGYLKKIIVCPILFTSSYHGSASEWKKKGRPIIFVGPGYTDKKLVDNLISILLALNKFNDLGFHFIFKPHIRDFKHKAIFRKYGINLNENNLGDLQNEANYIYIGIKSTLLLEAQRAGRISIILTHSNFPKYFESGEIFHESSIEGIFEYVIKLTRNL